MEKPGAASVVRPATLFIESLTCYRGWVGSVYYVPPRGFIPPIWSFEVIRRPDWLSPRLRADKLGKTFSSVEIETPSGDTVTLYEATIGAFGAAVWKDPVHPRPSGPLEMVTYDCALLDVGGSGVLSGYDWWQLNA